MPEISIVTGSYNRLDLLKPCIESARLAVGAFLPYEIIVVDGGSTDGALEYLKSQSDVKLIEHGELRGPVAAYNDGFQAAAGEYVAYINDDLELQPGTLSAACGMLDQDANLGVVSIQYCNPGGFSVYQPMTTVGNGRYPFASFGVVRRSLGDAAGWFGSFYHYYGDCRLSVMIQKMGYKLATLPGYIAQHRNADNALRGENRWDAPEVRSRSKEDGQRWADMWKGE